MDIQEIRKNLELLPDAIFELEKEYLEEKAQLDFMNDLTKHLVNKWKSEVIGSQAYKEQCALARDGYKNHIVGIAAQAKIVSQKASVFHREERRFEALRSLNKNI